MTTDVTQSLLALSEKYYGDFLTQLKQIPHTTAFDHAIQSNFNTGILYMRESIRQRQIELASPAAPQPESAGPVQESQPV